MTLDQEWPAMSWTSLWLHIDLQLGHQNRCFINNKRHQGLCRETSNQYLTLKQLQNPVTVTLKYQVVHEQLQKKVNSVVTNVDKKATLNHNAPSLRVNSELPECKLRTSLKKMRKHWNHWQIEHLIVGCIYASYPRYKSNILRNLFKSLKLLSKHSKYSKIFFLIFLYFYSHLFECSIIFLPYL